MQTVQTIAELRAALEPHRRSGSRIGLVPTMGALHAGHLALIHQARSTCDVVVATIFVNPTQFGPNEDLDRYPRPLETDLQACGDAGVDLVFVPSNNEMYPPGGRFLSLAIHELTDHLCGATRPGHFNGVLLVVNKLFNIIQPTDAWFGQKDIQQLILLETMVREFNIPVRIHRGETVREDDGLALSSRNRYLTGEERSRAPQLNAELRGLQSLILTGALPDEAALAQALAGAASRLRANGFRIDYLSVVDERTLQPRERVDPGHRYILAAAAWMGKTRLIDNIVLQSPG